MSATDAVGRGLGVVSVPLSEDGQRVCLLLARGQTQREAADAVGVSVSTIKRWAAEDDFKKLLAQLGDPALQTALDVMLNADDPNLRLRAARTLKRAPKKPPKDEHGITTVIIERRADGSFVVDGEPWPAEASTS